MAVAVHGWGFSSWNLATQGFRVTSDAPLPVDFHPGIITKTRSLRIIPHDHAAIDDDDLQDILTMVTHLWL